MADRTPTYRTHVWGWLKGPAQRLIMPTWLAITIGHDIFSWRPLDEPELAHEVCHVGQWNTNGILYIYRYFAASQKAAAEGKDRYWGNAFEIAAIAAADAVRARLAAEAAATAAAGAAAGAAAPAVAPVAAPAP
jgi:hypothetical protein